MPDNQETYEQARNRMLKEAEEEAKIKAREHDFRMLFSTSDAQDDALRAAGYDHYKHGDLAGKIDAAGNINVGALPPDVREKLIQRQAKPKKPATDTPPMPTPEPPIVPSTDLNPEPYKKGWNKT